MSAVLPVVVPLGAREPAAGFLSRLSYRNGLPAVAPFCSDWEIDGQGVVDGDEVALRHLGELAGIDWCDLLPGTIRRQGGGFALRGERLAKDFLRRDRLHVCPACLVEDVRSERLRPAAAAWCRVSWFLDSIRTCRTHRCELVEVPRPEGARTHDYAGTLAPWLASLSAVEAAAVPCGPSRLEEYLLDRLDGIAAPAPFLDRLEFHAAARTCEMLGMLALGGTAKRGMEQREWHRAGDAGFEIAAPGEDGIRRFLADVRRRHPYGRSGKSLGQAVYGPLYDWLSNGTRHPAYVPVRDLVRDDIVRTMPVGPGEIVLGRPVERRVVHCVRTASLETGAHPKRLRKLLMKAGVLTPDHATLPDHLATFDAEGAAEILTALTGPLTLKQAETYLGADRVHAKLLSTAGLIVPFSTPGADTKELLFARAELDRFLERLLQDAKPVEVIPEGMANLPAAAKRANCSAMEIVRSILDHRLDRVCRSSSATGYMSVLVDVAEIRGRVRGPELDGMASYRAAKALRTTDRAIKGLVAAGALACERRINPVNRCPVDIIPNAALAAFQARYVSVVEIARARQVHPSKVSAALAAAGIEPALDRERIGVTYVLRSEAEALAL